MHDSRTRSFLLFAAPLVLALTGCMMPVDDEGDADLATSTEALSSCQPSIPDSLEVPEGNRLAFSFYAEGEQVYKCTATGWVFDAPVADLFNAHGRLKGTHYRGPTWEALDGSTVVATRTVPPATVDPTAIPWLVLTASSHEGQGRMQRVSYIQRVNTTGGLAPTSGCDAGTIDALQGVAYTATYHFYEPVPGHNPQDGTR